MVFLLGRNVAENRPVRRTLESLFGIGPHISQRIMARLYIHPTCKLSAISSKQALELNAELAAMTIENELRRKVMEDIRRLRDMGSYRGRRHATRMPVRGQRTRTQGRTAFKLNWVDRFQFQI